MNNKENLIDLLNYLDDSQLEAVNELITVLSNKPNKGNLMQLAYGKRCFNIDSAIPYDYVKKVQAVYPDFDTFNYVTNCNQGIKLENINDTIISNLIEKLN